MEREALVDAMVQAPEPIRVQLVSCLSRVLNDDFPLLRNGVVDKVYTYLQSPKSADWAGPLLALYTLVKIYESAKPGEREPLHETMQLLLPLLPLLPLLQQRLAQLLADQSDTSVLLQKQILKIYFALIQYHLPLVLISRQVCTQWMQLLCVILGRPVPDVANQVDEGKRPELPWWKCKKRAFRIITRIFERYGSPGSVADEHAEISDFFFKAYSQDILKVVLQVLHQHRKNEYVSPRVLRAYAYRAQKEDEPDEEEEEEDDCENEELDSDEMDDDGQEYLARLARRARNSPFPVGWDTIEDDPDDDDEQDEEDEKEEEETELESFTTPLDEEDCPVDEYQVFKEVMEGIQNTDPMWFGVLTSGLSPEQQKLLQEVFLLADKRKAAAESRRIVKSGGYAFQNRTGPSSFNFGGPLR